MLASQNSFGPSNPHLGAIAKKCSRFFLKMLGPKLHFHDQGSTYAAAKGEELHQRLIQGETTYLLGIGPAGHNAAVALVKVSSDFGIELLLNLEEERFTGIKHDANFPINCLGVIKRYLHQQDLSPNDIFMVTASWDYLEWISNGFRLAFEEAPQSFQLLRGKSAPKFNSKHAIDALKAPFRLKKAFGIEKPLPVVGLRHHDNHAYFSYAISPFANCSEPVMVAAIDGYGDDAAWSLYVTNNKKLTCILKNKNIFDSLGIFYATISSTQGGWSVLSSEGRYMGASAWGDNSRSTNPFYKGLRKIFQFCEGGQLRLNRQMANYQCTGEIKPYRQPLIDLLGKPVPPDKMWHPDAVLNVENIDHADISQSRLDKAAALQLVFEDGLFHIIDDLIHRTGSHKLILTGGTALNCIANMRLADKFNEAYYLAEFQKQNTRLHVWVPPMPGDAGAAVGSAYNFAMQNGAQPGHALSHSFYCGIASTTQEIEQAIADADNTKSIHLGCVLKEKDTNRIADLISYILSQNGVIGISQGVAETGPRALGHRSILANPCNPNTMQVINDLVKFREKIRPLAPMVTLDEAKRLYELSDGASDDNYNAYNYMILTAKAKPVAAQLVPAVVHKDKTSRIQIVRQEHDPLCYAILRANGQRLGVEAAVNTSLNVGAPIAQTPKQAIETLHRSQGMSGLLLIGDEGEVYLVWHDINKPPKDNGRQLLEWFKEWGESVST